MMHTRYIATYFDWNYYGAWGSGDAVEEAVENLVKACSGKKHKNLARAKHWLWEFTSELPFAPADREATDEESDAYMSDGGSMCWKRCERRKVEHVKQ